MLSEIFRSLAQLTTRVFRGAEVKSAHDQTRESTTSRHGAPLSDVQCAVDRLELALQNLATSMNRHHRERLTAIQRSQAEVAAQLEVIAGQLDEHDKAAGTRDKSATLH